MSWDPRTWIGALRDSHEQLDGLVRPLQPEQLRAQSYDTGWTIAQVLSHIGSGAEIARLQLAAALSGRGGVDQAAFGPIWDAWNHRTPQAQAADCLTWQDEHLRHLEQLTAAQLDAISLDFGGMALDAVGLVRIRLCEHVLHTWDIAVSMDPRATIAPSAAGLLMGFLPTLLRFAGKPMGDSFRVRVRTTEPADDYLLDVGEPVTISTWDRGLDADGTLALPAEALLRLVSGRLDDAHTPPLTADGVELDRLRKVFPGY